MSTKALSSMTRTTSLPLLLPHKLDWVVLAHQRKPRPRALPPEPLINGRRRPAATPTEMKIHSATFFADLERAEAVGLKMLEARDVAQRGLSRARSSRPVTAADGTCGNDILTEGGNTSTPGGRDGSGRHWPHGSEEEAAGDDQPSHRYLRQVSNVSLESARSSLVLSLGHAYEGQTEPLRRWTAAGKVRVRKSSNHAQHGKDMHSVLSFDRIAELRR